MTTRLILINFQSPGDSDFFYRSIHGDKDTFHMAFRKVGKSP